MLLFTDVYYHDTGGATAAAVLIETWAAHVPGRELVIEVREVAEYVPGQFFRRELPCLLAMVAKIQAPLEGIVVDGHAWLQTNRAGLGVHVNRATALPVIGVAKRPFVDGVAVPVLRGGSNNPLHVSTEDYDLNRACVGLQSMHGPHRIPTILKRVDRLSRGDALATP